MERAIAIAKLGKLLGKKLGYRIDNKAPSPEERATAKAELPEATKIRIAAAEKMTARREAILAADAEYQALVAGYKVARQRADKLMSMQHWYKFSVGTSNNMFFYVAASGDSWEEVIKEVERKLAAKQLIVA